ncbi:transposase [Streptomyces sp. KR80]|uniref:transposase n=1 Tax=Streptomyces sp. KR80 TaxID=3457426 RepID=UPI003FD5ADA0
MWAVDGMWERGFTALMAKPTPMRTWTGPSRWIPRSCALISTRPGPAKGAPAGEPADHAIGRSRGGLTTKIHLAADGRCRPLAFHLTAGQAGDAPTFTGVMARLRVPRRRGRPRARPDMVLADKAYSSRAIREHLCKRGIRAVIPVPADQQGHRLRDGSPRWQATCLRPRGIQAAQRCRAVHQPPEAVARHRHPLREDRNHLPGRTPRRRHLPVVRTMIQTTSPSCVSGPARSPRDG